MKFNAQLQPLDNPNQSNLNPQEEWAQKVNERLFNRKPANAPNVVSVSIEPEYSNTYTLSRLNTSTVETGILISGFSFGVRFLQTPTAYKLNSINDINLRANTSFTTASGAIGTPPTPDGDYTMYYYVSIIERPTGSQAFYQDPFLMIEYEFNWDNTLNRFSFTENTKNLQLKDTTDERQLLDVFGATYPDFKTDPEKVTPSQYQRLSTEDLVFNVNSGFDGNQLSSSPTPNPTLSANNKAHFEFWLYANGAWTPTTPFTYLNINTTLVFTYSGLFADFTPVS